MTDWEYTECDFSYPENKGIQICNDYSTYDIKRDLFFKIQELRPDFVRKYHSMLDQGWEPMTEYGPGGVYGKVEIRKERSDAPDALSVILSLGMSLLAWSTTTYDYQYFIPSKFSVKMRRKRG